jgi:hypothetical protein
MRRLMPCGRAAVIGILAMTMLACSSETPQTPPAALNERATNPAAKSGPSGIAELMAEVSGVRPPPSGSHAAAVGAAPRPIAESQDVRSSPPGGTGEQPLVRPEFVETIAPAWIFSPPAAQVDGVRIGWYFNRAIDAFREAIDENKPLVLIVGEQWCDYCLNLARDALRCAAIDRFAGDAAFAYSFVSSDRGAESLADSLRITAYPTITVLEPETRMLLERRRITGYFDATLLGGHLETILWKTPPRLYPTIDWDGKTELPDSAFPKGPLRSGSPATVASAESGAASRGLEHIPPTPKCR